MNNLHIILIIVVAFLLLGCSCSCKDMKKENINLPPRSINDYDIAIGCDEEFPISFGDSLCITPEDYFKTTEDSLFLKLHICQYL